MGVHQVSTMRSYYYFISVVLGGGLVYTLWVLPSFPSTGSNGNTPAIVYGHLHMAKTAGTTLNGELASTYERVCGHKGYSYDAFQDNLRRNTSDISGDSISKVYKEYSRSRVPHSVMLEIGFENCDYISHETKWNFWPTHFQNWSAPLELHIPCRDPVEHLMSMCNYKGHTYTCDAPLEDEIEKCLIEMDRFSLKLVNTYSNIHTKCFRSELLKEYLHFMDKRLDRKRHPVRYVFRATNKPRFMENECIWNNQELKKSVEKYLYSKFDYFRYCNGCIGSQDELNLH